MMEEFGKDADRRVVHRGAEGGGPPPPANGHADRQAREVGRRLPDEVQLQRRPGTPRQQASAPNRSDGGEGTEDAQQ